MIHLIQNAWAAGSTPVAPNQGGLGELLFPVLALVAIYIFMIRPQTRRQKEQKKMIDRLAVGDEIVMTSGILGRITEIGPQYMMVEIASGVSVKVQRQMAQQVLPGDTIKKAR